MSSVPSKTAVTQIALGDPVSPAFANAPHDNLETNIDSILSFLKTASTGHFEQDTVTTSGVVFGFRAGLVRNNNSVNIVSAGTLTLPVSDVSFVEVDGAGVVSDNIVGFTAGKIPLFQITCNATDIIDVIDLRASLVSSDASDLNFTPTADLAATDVQAAIEETYTETKGAAIAMAVVFGS